MPSRFALATVLEAVSAANDRVLPTILTTSPLSLPSTLLSLNPVITSFWLTHFLAFLQLFLSLLTRSYAWNDRFWSIIPPLYALLYALHAPLSLDRRTDALPDLRLSLMATLVILWGTRLTRNAHRRGFYSPSFVDYRYIWLRTHYIRNSLLFAVNYAIFSCALMTVLLALSVSPLYFAWVARGNHPPLNALDALATVLFLAFLTMESLADNQQASFQRRKAAWLALPEKHRDHEAAELRTGFLQTGLFSWSRHPNFFAEMAIWWSFYIFTVAVGAPLLNWAMLGPISYTLLFQITTPLTEGISAEKYPAYSDYQTRVSRLIPSPFSRSAPVPDKKTKEN